MNLHFDIETFSECDLRRRGLRPYARHYSTEIIIAAWALGDAPVQSWDIESGGPIDELMGYLLDPAITKWAHNAAFEAGLLEGVWGIDVDLDQWRCTMVLAYSLGLPGALKNLPPVLGIDDSHHKHISGTQLIGKFCSPREPTPKLDFTRWTRATATPQWDAFVEYCKGDVVAERAVHALLSKWDVDPRLWEDWRVDQLINDNGLPVDDELVAACLYLNNALRAPLLEEAAEITGLANPNSRDQLLGWLRQRGYEGDTLTAEDITRNLEAFHGRQA